MAVRKVDRNGETRLLIDIQYKRRDGSRARFRKDAEVQSMTAARAEEKRYLLNIAAYGEPFEPQAPGSDSVETSESNPEAKMKFAALVDEYRQNFMVAELKVTSRVGYEAILRSILLPRFGELSLDAVNGKAAAELDVALSKKKLARTTRNNVQAVLRSVLRYAKTRGFIEEMPANLPRLKPAGRSILEIPTDDHVDQIIEGSCESHRCGFTLMAEAALRPNEVRALREKDVMLRWEDGEPVGGYLTVREGISHGQRHTPKTGQREIPISRELARVLARILKGSREAFVAVTENGESWGQSGLRQAFERVTKRVGLEGWSIYCLRHYAITSWLRAGIPVHVVQRMAGHSNLETTQRYVHFMKADLEEAARRLPVRNRKNGSGQADEG